MSAVLRKPRITIPSITAIAQDAYEKFVKDCYERNMLKQYSQIMGHEKGAPYITVMMNGKRVRLPVTEAPSFRKAWKTPQGTFKAAQVLSVIDMTFESGHAG